MDSPGAPAAAASLISRALLVAALLIFPVHHSGAFTPTGAQSESQDTLTAAQKLLSQERWQEVVRLLDATPDSSPELQYDYGLALAHLERWDDARKAFLAGRRDQPRDKRFSIELAGIAFKQKKYSQSASYLRAALRLNPKDPYANDFLATVYFLQGNLEAALKYWNQIGKPGIQEVHTPVTLHVNPALLDHAFAFSPASTLSRDELLTTEARLRALGIFPSYRLELLARPDEKFDVQFQAQERNGFGNNAVEALLAVFRGLPYQQVNLEYFNIGRSATNFVSLLRWDAQKRRALASLSGPFRRNPKWIYRIQADARNENWEIRKSFTGPAPVLAGLNMRRAELSPGIARLVGWRWSWSLGAQFSYRDYRSVSSANALGAALLSQGYELAQNARLNYELWRAPERRLTVGSEVSSQIARLWPTKGTSEPESFAKLQGALKTQWLPRPQGDDYQTRWDLRAGKTFGEFPFDELFMLGMERDNDLWLRGHIGTRDGQKGSAPLGSRYFLSNWEINKNVYRNGIFTVKLAPFLDTGKIGGASSVLAANQWLWDTGVQCKLSVLGVGVSVVYGKDLRSGNNAFYTTVGR
jgi:tetratricopeptide (TPR) repeat protein